MKIGQSEILLINSRQRWNDSKIEVNEGEVYRFKASGTWKDGDFLCPSKGYKNDSKLFNLTEFLRRSPTSDWFALIGSVNQDKSSFFLVGDEYKIPLNRSGKFYFFANDISFMYFNNSGSIELCVERLK